LKNGVVKAKFVQKKSYQS